MGKAAKAKQATGGKAAFAPEARDEAATTDGPRGPSPIELPSLPAPYQWDTVNKVRHALMAFEQGQFAAAADLVDAMGRDDRIKGVLRTRLAALTCLPVKFEAKGDSEQAEEAAKTAREDWARTWPASTLREFMKWGVMLGVSVAHQTIDLGDKWRPVKVKVWHPRHLVWRQDLHDGEGGYMIHTRNLGQVEVTPGENGWILFTPFGFKRGWMEAHIRSLPILWLSRAWALRDWNRASEQYGQGVKKARIPRSAKKADKERFLHDLANLSTDSVLRLPATGPTGEAFDLELLFAEQSTHAAFKELLEHVEACIAIDLVGQNLTTEVRGSGSLAAGRVHGEIKDEIIQADAQAAEGCLYEQQTRVMAQFNQGDGENAPKGPTWDTKPPADHKQQAETMVALGEAVKGLEEAGIRVDKAKLAERFEVPVSDEPEDKDPVAKAAIFAYHIEQGVVTVDEVRARLGLEPLPDGAGAKTLTQAKSEEAAANADKMAEAAKQNPSAGAGQQPGKPKPGKEALTVKPTADVEGQVYADAVADEARDAAAKTLRPDVLAVLAVVRSAKNREELRQGLVRAYGKMDPTALSELTQRALILAELDGMAAILEGV